MNEQKFTIEEMEDNAVKKSNLAKKLGVATGLGALGVGAAAAATATLYQRDTTEADSHPEPSPAAPDPQTVTADDLGNAATAGAESTTVVEEHVTEEYHYQEVPASEPEPEPEPQPTPEPESEPAPHSQPDPSSGEATIEYHERYEVHDAEGNVQQAAETFTITTPEGEQVSGALIDEEGDGKAETVWIDKNANGQIEENEIQHFEENDRVNMYNTDRTTVVDNVADEGHAADESDGEIHNDFVDQQHDDFAQNNGDYVNDGDVSRYTAGTNLPDEGATNSVDAFAQEDDSDFAHEETGEDAFAHEDVYEESGSESMTDELDADDPYSHSSFDDSGSDLYQTDDFADDDHLM